MNAVLTALLLAASTTSASLPASRMLVKLELHECPPDLEAVLPAAVDATKEAVERAGYRPEILWGPKPISDGRAKYFLLEGHIRCHPAGGEPKTVQAELDVTFFPNAWVAASVSRHSSYVHGNTELASKAESLFSEQLDKAMVQLSSALEAVPPCVVNVEIEMGPTTKLAIAQEIVREIKAAAGPEAVEDEKLESSTWSMRVKVEDPELLQPVFEGIQERMRRNGKAGSGQRIKRTAFGGGFVFRKPGCGDRHLFVFFE